MTKSLNERTLDRMWKEHDEFMDNLDNKEWLINYYGGQEAYDEILALAQKAIDAIERRKNEPIDIDADNKAAAAWICGGPDDDVEQWGRDIVIAADEFTLKCERRQGIFYDYDGNLITDRVRFKEHMFEGTYAEHYVKYRNHEFMIYRTHPEDESGSHVQLICTDDLNVVVDGYVHRGDLTNEVVDKS